MSPTSLRELSPAPATPRRHLRRRLTALALAAMAATTGSIITGVATAPEALAADNGQWSVFPAQPKGRQDRVAYFLEVSAGQTYKDAMTIRNRLERPVVLNLRSADAFNTNSGGFAPRKIGTLNTGVGSWVKLSQTTVTVPAKAQVTVPFTMTVPRSASPGDHVGAVLALDPTIRGNATGTVLGTTYEVGARVYARVAGQLTNQLSIKDVQLDVTQKAIVPFLQHGTGTISYTVVNTGNTRINATEQIAVTGLFGRSLSEFPARGLPELLPGGEFVVAMPWDGVPALDLVHIRVDVQAPNVSAGGDRSDWVISWLFLLLVLGVILAFMAYRRWRDRRRGEDAQPVSAAAGTPFPSAVSVTTAGGLETDQARGKRGRHGS